MCEAFSHNARLDEGIIVGGFEHAYEAWIVDEPHTPIIRRIAQSTGVRLDNSVTFQVAVEGERTWTREFAGSLYTTGPCLFTTPKPNVLGVLVRGVAFAVDVRHPDDAFDIDVHPVTCSASDVRGGRLFFASFDRVYAFDGARILWESRRVSLDGISDLSYADGCVHGIATDVGVDVVPFNVDAETGDAYDGFQGFIGFVKE
jgi:hypothetical protein